MSRILVTLVAASALMAQQPPITNANVQTESASRGPDRAGRAPLRKQTGPAWIGYTVPAIPREGSSCCWNDNYRGCGLEGQRNVTIAGTPPAPVKLEGPSHV